MDDAMGRDADERRAFYGDCFSHARFGAVYMI